MGFFLSTNSIQNYEKTARCFTTANQQEKGQHSGTVA